MRTFSWFFEQYWGTEILSLIGSEFVHRHNYVIAGRMISFIIFSGKLVLKVFQENRVVSKNFPAKCYTFIDLFCYFIFWCQFWFSFFILHGFCFLSVNSHSIFLSFLHHVIYSTLYSGLWAKSTILLTNFKLFRCSPLMLILFIDRVYSATAKDFF